MGKFTDCGYSVEIMTDSGMKRDAVGDYLNEIKEKVEW